MIVTKNLCRPTLGLKWWPAASIGTVEAAVPVENSRSDILMVQPTQNWHGQRLTDGLDGRGGSARPSAVISACGAGLVAVFLIRFEQMTKVLIAKHDDMVKTIPPDRSDEPLCTSILPW